MRRDPANHRVAVQVDELCRRSQLDAAIRRRVITHNDARSWISPKVRHLPVTGAGHDIEAVVAPLVPHGRKKDGPITPVRRKHTQDRQFEQVAEIVWGQALAHPPSLAQLRAVGFGPMDEHVALNRASWDASAADWAELGRERWADTRIRWGIWDTPEDELQLLPDVDGLDVVELGCGTGYFSSWLARRGARPVGLDNSSKQLASARAFQREFDMPFPLVHGDAERAPFTDASFDLALSEYGAIIWCDPHRWIPEAARILRPGGRLVCFGNSYLLMLTFPDEGEKATQSLQRPHFGMHRFDNTDDGTGSVEFHIPHGEMIRLLRRSGFEVEDLVEVGAPADAVSAGYQMATPEWAHRWPNEQAWIARKRG